MPEQTHGFQPLFGLWILYAVVVLGVALVVITALSRVKPEHGGTLREIFRQTRFLELTTVLVIIISGTTLAWVGKLSEGITALLSGIAGYVLGGVSAKSTTEFAKNETTQTTPGAGPEDPKSKS